jgi:D-sedoheptulose 7-phosphate isomerase
MENEKIINDYLQEVRDIANGVSVKDINDAVDIIYESCIIHGKKILLCGNGGSASTASHFANDLLKLGFQAICLNDNPAIITAITNDSGFGELYNEQMGVLFGQKDVLIVLSVHGGSGEDKAGVWSQNLVMAVKRARCRYGKIIGLLGYDGGLIKQLADVSIIVGNSTPQTESWHLHIEHLICLLLKERIKCES